MGRPCGRVIRLPSPVDRNAVVGRRLRWETCATNVSHKTLRPETCLAELQLLLPNVPSTGTHGHQGDWPHHFVVPQRQRKGKVKVTRLRQLHFAHLQDDPIK